MSDQERMNETEIREIEDALRSGELRSADRLEAWVRGLVAEVERGRSGAAKPDTDTEPPRKQHGDGLLDGSGSRHGEAPPGQ